MRALQGLPKRTLLLLSGRSRNGSVNTVREGALAAQLRLGILPLGTANDLARTWVVSVNEVEIRGGVGAAIGQAA